MNGSSLVLKQDVLGRVWASAQRRAAVVAEFRRSGLSGLRFARLSGIKYPTLMAWVKREGEGHDRPAVAGRRNRPGTKPAVLVEAVVGEPSGTGAPLVVELGPGVRMELADARQMALAAHLILALRKSC